MYRELVADYARLLGDLSTVAFRIIYDDSDQNKSLVDVLKDYFDEETPAETTDENHTKVTETQFENMINRAKECILSAESFDFKNVPYCASYYDEDDMMDRIAYVRDVLNPLLYYIPYNKNTDLIRRYDYYNQIMHNVKVITRVYNELSKTVYKDFQMEEDMRGLHDWIRGIAYRGMSNNYNYVWKTMNYTCELLCKLNKFAIRLKTADCFHINIDGIGDCINDSNRIMMSSHYPEASKKYESIDSFDSTREIFIKPHSWDNYNFPVSQE